MAKKKGVKYIGLVLLVIGIVAFIPFIVGSGASYNKHMMVCSVTLSNPIGDVKIDQVSCQRGKDCLFSLNVAPLGLIPWLIDDGAVYLRANDGTFKSAKYNLWEFQQQVLNLQVCTESFDGLIEVIDANGVTIDSKRVGV